MARTPFRFVCLLGLLGSTISFAQDEPEKDPPELEGRPANADGYDAYVLLTEATYIPRGKEGNTQGILLKFDLARSVPRGAVIRISLDRYGEPVEETTYTLKDETRTGLSHNWKLKAKHVVGEYGLRSYLELAKQTAAVQGLLKQLGKEFPPAYDPWPWYIKSDFYLGTPEDEAAESGDLCEVYTNFLDGLLENMTEFKDKMDEALKGEGLAEGGKLDAGKFEAYVKEWRAKQAKVQKQIFEFGGNPLASKRPVAYRQLKVFSSMTSKRCVVLQKEVADKFKAADPKPKVAGFDKDYSGNVDVKVLQSTYDAIRTSVGCPAEEEEGDAAAAPGADPEAEAAKPAEEPAPEEPTPEEPAPEPEPEEGAKAKKNADKKPARKK